MHYPLIQIEDVTKSYKLASTNVVNVLKGINLEIELGEFVCIFGPSGSGKSTLLNLIAGMEGATTGRVRIRHHDLAKFDNDDFAGYHRTKVGMVFQAFNLIKSLNVWENVALPQTANGANYRARKKRALHLLKMLHLEHYAHRHVNELSGGEQQRVAIARALINNPYLMILDEPTGNLDSKAADEIMSLVHGLHAKGSHTILLVTHNPIYLHYASRVIYLRDGLIVREERPGQLALFQHPIPDENFAALAEYKEIPT